MVFRSQNLGTRFAHCCRGMAAPRPSQWTELENILIYYMHTHFLLCIENLEFTWISTIPIQYYRFHFNLFTFWISNCLLWQKKQTSIILNIFTYLIKLSVCNQPSITSSTLTMWLPFSSHLGHDSLCQVKHRELSLSCLYSDFLHRTTLFILKPSSHRLTFTALLWVLFYSILTLGCALRKYFVW